MHRLHTVRPITISTKDGTKLDGMLLLSQQPISPDNKVGNLVIFCCPNASYYEYALDGHADWIKFYHGQNFDILLWNYRGYGRSEGYPTPAGLCSDGEDVMKYVRDKLKPRFLILHGESLGGAVAVHMAQKCGCNALFVDRTFSTMTEMAKETAGYVYAWIFRLITCWELDVTTEYLQAHCYKVVANDPHDKTIPAEACLTMGIVRAVVSPTLG